MRLFSCLNNARRLQCVTEQKNLCHSYQRVNKLSKARNLSKLVCHADWMRQMRTEIPAVCMRSPAFVRVISHSFSSVRTSYRLQINDTHPGYYRRLLIVASKKIGYGQLHSDKYHMSCPDSARQCVYLRTIRMA
jgi:hypothetical protein